MSTLLITITQVSILLAFIMVMVLILTYVERKVLARIQMRMGPMRTGPHGILQSLADMMKLLAKEDIRPHGSDRMLFYLAPLFVFVPSFLIWVTIPFTHNIVVENLELGLFYIVAVSTVSIVGMVLAGWASGGKYSILGSARSAAQLISYELPLVFVIAGVGILAQSFNLITIVNQQSSIPAIVYQPLGFTIFFVAGLAEVGRIPFDIPHAESEVVGGPFVEYSGIRWSIFFLAEYANTLAIATLSVLLFLGGWSGPLTEHFEWLQPIWLILKVSAILFLIFWIRATLPRFRIDQLMQFAWKILLPLSFVYIMVNATVPFVETVLTSNAASNQLTGIAQIILSASQILILFLVAFAISKRRKKYLTHLHQGVPA